MNEIKKDELDHVTIKNEVLRKYFPKSYTPKQMQDTIIRLLEKWQRSKQRDMERYNRDFYEAHRDMLTLRSAAKKAFDAYKKENGSDKKLPRISELNAEYAMLLERKKSSYAEYRKTKSEMQDWLVAQKIVQEILKEDEQKKEQLHEQEVRQEEENRQSSR